MSSSSTPGGRVAAPAALTGWCLQMEMLIGGRWQPAASGLTEEVTSPFARAVTGTVPVADAADVRAALRDLIRLAAFEGTQPYGDALRDSAGQRHALRAGRRNLHLRRSGAVRAIQEIDAGNVHIDWTPLWRADLMPYGGLKARPTLGPRSRR